MNDFPIKVGSTLLTLVDPEPGSEAEYNRWYERDHFYAGCRVEQVVDLYKDGRGFAHGTDAQTVLLEQPTAYCRDSDPVPIELALDHAYDGADGATGSGVASMVSWSYQSSGSSDTDNAPMDLGIPPGGPERRVQMFFLDRELTEVWDRFRTYTDQLR